MSAFFVTGTGTDVGKTFVTAGLIRFLRGINVPASAVKPIISGFDPGNAAASDSGQLLAAMGEELTDDALRRLSPWQFSAALSPDMAAALEDREIDFELLLNVCREAMAAAKDALFIEGVGGIMVPLDDRHTVMDWMAALNLPLILVAGSYLGAISHTLTALDCLKRRDLAVDILVVSESAGGTVPLADTIDTLSRFVGDVPIAAMPRGGDMQDNFAQLWSVIR
ncbi:MAG TPA: dethiobiotin synthase [Rhizomicrobium sp.]|jgi:dethiobiotin synthetase